MLQPFKLIVTVLRRRWGHIDEGYYEVVNPRKDTRLENTSEDENNVKNERIRRRSHHLVYLKSKRRGKLDVKKHADMQCKFKNIIIRPEWMRH